MEFFKFPSIEQFKNIVHSVKSHCEYHDIPLPTLTFTGTVKVHGTNAAIVRLKDGTIYAQSRSRIITPTSDNAGFAAFVHLNRDKIEQMFQKAFCSLNCHDSDIVVYGEWFGSNIQKGVAVSGLPHTFGIFAVKVDNEWEIMDGELNNRVINRDLKDHSINIYNMVNDFPIYKIDIDFNNPELAQNKLIELTEAVEAECPVGKYFGNTGVGEGIVWETQWNGQRINFKVKGEKHSSSKVKTLAAVDTEQLETLREVVEYVATENRLKQAISEFTTNSGREPSVQDMGDLIRWVVNDSHKEELDTILKAGIMVKQFNSALSKVAREWFLKELNKV